MEKPLNKAAKGGNTQKFTPTVSAVLDDGAILETVFNPKEKKTEYIIWQDGEWRRENSFTIGPFERFVPYSPRNNLIKNQVVLFPSEPEQYESEEDLVTEIQDFIHRYVDVSPLFEKIAAYYALFSWVYDRFNELPYLRVRGDPGSGKTRFLLMVGSLCYKPIFASGASTVSPLFRILDSFRGTMIIDESDFRMSDEKAEVVKILNNGNVKGFPVLRSEVSGKGEFDPRAYHVFGPKLVATRGFFEDRALESRFLTEEMGQYRLRDDIPISSPDAYKEEALHLRNKLLLFRFRNLHKGKVTEHLVDRTIEPRLNQIFVPLLSIIEDPQAREDLKELARQYNREMISERGMDTEAQVLEIIREILDSPYGTPQLSVKDIASRFSDRHGNEYKAPITPKWMGGVIRKKLNLKTHKSNGIFIIAPSEFFKLERLYEKYGVSPGSETDNEKASPDLSYQPVK